MLGWSTFLFTCPAAPDVKSYELHACWRNGSAFLACSWVINVNGD